MICPGCCNHTRRPPIVGQGSRAIPGRTLFIAVDPSQGDFIVRGGSVAPCGLVEGSTRVVHQVSGDVLWREPNEQWVVRLRTDTSSSSQPRIRIDAQAPFWTVLATLAWPGSYGW
jgi:hypothetical protein